MSLPFHYDAVFAYLLNREEPITVDLLGDAMARVGRNECPTLLWDLWREGVLDDVDVLAAGVEHAWTAAEFPLTQLGEWEWTLLFDATGYLENAKRPQWPTDGEDSWPRQLFRGSVPELRKGWSWTGDQEKAAWFAARTIWQGRGKVWTAEVEAHRLLAHFTEGRPGEDEYVIETEGLEVVPFQQ